MTAGKAAIGRLKTGVPGLDAVLGGALPEFPFNIIAGPPGCGKTMLAHQIMFALAMPERPALYFTILGEPPFKMLRYQQQFDFFDTEAIGLVDTWTPDMSVDEVATLLVAEIKRFGASRVVIDSLSGFEVTVASSFRADFRESVSRMVSALTATGAAVLMTCELEDRYDRLALSPHGTAFLTDAIVMRRHAEVDSRLQRVIAVVKLRGGAHSTERRMYHIDADGIKIGSMLADHEGMPGAAPSRSRGAAPLAVGPAPKTDPADPGSAP